ncbi:hypothetical protein BH11BAC4_BH11BAC4_09950 [soil metagenome]
MTGTFKANNPYNNFLLLLYGLVLKLPMFLHPHVPQPQQVDGFLYKYFLLWMRSFSGNIPVLYSLVAFLFLYLQAISLNKLVNVQRLMQKPNYLVGMSYLLITSLFSDWYYLSSPLIVNSLLIWALANLCNLHNIGSPKSSLFNIGMMIGVATFFYFPSIAFLLLIVVGLAITRPFRLPEWLMVLLGVLAPYYFLGAWVFLTDKWKGYKFPGFSVTVPRFHQTPWAAYTAVALAILAIVIGVYFILDNMRRQVVQARKNWNLIFLYLLVAIFVPFLSASKGFDYWILTSVPVATLSAPAFFYPDRKIVPQFIHWGMVAIGIVMGYYLR